MSFMSANPIESLVMGDAQEPCLEGAVAPKAVQFAERLQEDVLGDVERILASSTVEAADFVDEALSMFTDLVR